MEYQPAGILFDVVENFKGVGEIISKFFMNQILKSAEYLQSQNVAHLDLKLENILVDKEMNIKLTDFGFSSYQGKRLLECYGGTMSYMAPEIIELKAFDGHKADVFSLGVILFITVTGFFPFQSAKKDDKYYSLLCNPSKIDKFWQLTGSESTSTDF